MSAPASQGKQQNRALTVRNCPACEEELGCNLGKGVGLAQKA